VALIVEVLAPRGGEVRQRLRLERFPCTVGRQLDNDLVLDDPYVDAHHARFVLDEDGSVVLEDLGSVNKLSVPSHPRAERVRVAPGAELQVGRVRLRIRDPEAPVRAALALHGGVAVDDANRAWFERPVMRFSAIVGAALLFGASAWLTTAERNAGTVALTAALGFVVLGLIWGGIWAVAGRAVVGQFRVAAHLAVVAWASLVSIAVGRASSWIEFLYPDNGVMTVLEGIVYLALLAAMVAWHLAYASHQPRARRWRIGAMVAGLVILIVGAFDALEDESFTDVPEFSSVIKSAPQGVIPLASVEEFAATVVDLRAEVDSLLAAPGR
jgi:hypothetical protein